ncbi:hypothetical protein [Haladaptatus caseinilyticus]|uniref:hypothetical protein n=1 Tax=Haladaptatus caseinilyticus TaxID=2993314 RepID=UPI00224B5005|nr:hypothetical protein [Haladaptatus caseinilyticus]
MLVLVHLDETRAGVFDEREFGRRTRQRIRGDVRGGGTAGLDIRRRGLGDVL